MPSICGCRLAMLACMASTHLSNGGTGRGRGLVILLFIIWQHHLCIERGIASLFCPYIKKIKLPAETAAAPSRVRPIDFRCEAGNQNVSLTDTGLRFDDRMLAESKLSTLYGMPVDESKAS